MSSHHPIKEGKMLCSDCHDSHGQTTGNLLEPTVNLVCYKCHMEKQGPFVYEHPPVTESCSICHEPHGTVANSLLHRDRTTRRCGETSAPIRRCSARFTATARSVTARSMAAICRRRIETTSSSASDLKQAAGQDRIETFDKTIAKRPLRAMAIRGALSLIDVAATSACRVTGGLIGISGHDSVHHLHGGDRPGDGALRRRR
jgi:predicted CXXCH cytochrome family protein